MGAWDRKYSDEQREAVISARLDRGLIYRQVSELAATGDLAPELAPFKIPESTVQSLARRALEQRQGRVENPIADMPHRDAIEQLRRRAVTIAALMLEEEEKRKPKDIEPERLRQIMRLVHEASKIPAATDPRPPTSATRDANGKRHETRGGPAGALLADHRKAQGETEADATQSTAQHGDASAEHDALPRVQTESEQDAVPGSQPSALVDAVLG